MSGEPGSDADHEVVAILRRLEAAQVVDQVTVREPFAGQVDVLFTKNGEDMLVMASDKTDLVRVVGKRRETDVPPTEVEDVLRHWGRRVPIPSGRFGKMDVVHRSPRQSFLIALGLYALGSGIGLLLAYRDASNDQTTMLRAGVVGAITIAGLWFFGMRGHRWPKWALVGLLAVSIAAQAWMLDARSLLAAMDIVALVILLRASAPTKAEAAPSA